MIYASYHNHTPLCRHATGSPEEYVEEAIRGGLKIFGFSDHTPYLYDGDYYPYGVKMLPQEIEQYVDTVLTLKQKYASDITIHLGLEMEYYPKFFDRLLEFLAPYPLEYFLLAQHNLGNDMLPDGTPDVSSFTPTTDEKQLIRYVDQCIEAMNTGKFIYFAHPDVFHFTGPDEVYQEHMRRLCIAAKKIDLPLEINLQGVTEDRFYPNPLFWSLASEIGNKVVLGADAHRTSRVIDLPAIKKAEEMAARLHLQLLTDIEDRF